jgi:carbonic anhydrase
MKMKQANRSVRLKDLLRSTRFNTATVLLCGSLLVTGCSTMQRVEQPTSKAEQSALSPQEAFNQLKAGNQRFVSGDELWNDYGKERQETAAAQYPYAVILSCIDSRGPIEAVFDQGIGDVFSVRIAGNIVDEDVLGSLEFACKLAGAKVIAVVGHSDCGAVKGACSDAKLGNLTGLLNKIKPSVEEARQELPDVSATDKKFVNKVTDLNVQHVLKEIREKSPVLLEMVESGKILIVGGVHDLGSGEVRFFNN